MGSPVPSENFALRYKEFWEAINNCLFRPGYSDRIREQARGQKPGTESCELSGVTTRTAKTQRDGIIEGMNQLPTMPRNQKASIKQQRTEHGMEAKFSKLPSKELQKIVGVSSDLSC